MWLKIDHTKHPNAGSRTIEDIEAEIFDSCIDNGVLVARGSWFLTEKDKPLPGLHFRTTFASATNEQMSTAIQRFGEAVRKSFVMS